MVFQSFLGKRDSRQNRHKMSGAMEAIQFYGYNNNLIIVIYLDLTCFSLLKFNDKRIFGLKILCSHFGNISGHQKKIMLAIDRLKRILSGTKRLSTLDGRDAPEALEPPMASIRWSGERSSPPPPAPPQYNELPPYLKPRRSSSGDSLSTNSSGGEMKSLNQPLESEYANTSNMQPKPPAVVPIKVKRSMSQSTPNGMSEAKESVTHQKMCQSFHAPPDRTSDYSDRETTPTGDDSFQMSSSPMGGPHPVAPVVAAKPKPVAMIVAKSKQPSREGSPDIIDIEKHEAEKNNDSYKSPVKNLEGFKYPLATNGSLKRRTSEHIYDTPQTGTPRTVSNYVNYPPMTVHQVSPGPASPLHVSTQFSYAHQQGGSPRGSQQNSPGGRGKKAPPPPPKRNASLRQNETANKVGLSPSHIVTSSGPGMTSVLSPPPIQQKPQISAPQAQAFVNCVQSLSERFGKKSEENSAGDNVSSDNEELPPAPPVAMEIIEPKISNYGLLGKSDKTSSGEYMLQQRLKRESSTSASSTTNGVESAFGVKLRQAKTESQPQNQSSDSAVSVNQSSTVISQESVQDKNGVNIQNAQICVQQNSENANASKDTDSQVSDVGKQRKDSTGSGKGELSLSSSTSSLDSNTLPFANENVGTIKQRAQQSKPSLVMILDDGCSAVHAEDETNSNGSSDNTDTIKRTPNKLPKPQQQTVQKLQQPKLLPKPNQQVTAVQQQQPQQQGSQQQQHRTEQERLAAQQQKLGQTPPQKAQPQYNASVTASYVSSVQSSPQSSGKGKRKCWVLINCCKVCCTSCIWSCLILENIETIKTIYGVFYVSETYFKILFSKEFMA